MGGIGVLQLLLATVPVGLPATPPGSYLFEPAYALDRQLRGTPCPYDLQPGDICFALNDNVLSRIGHRLSGAGLPNHSMIVFEYPDGRLGILEAGPHSRLTISAFDAHAHLRSYEADGARVWVRRRRCPLAPEQSDALTRFCMAQDGKTFPVVRLLGQLSRLRSRGPIRTAWMGQANLEQRSYFCSELVLNSLIAAGALEAEHYRPSATYPSDLFFSHSRNPHVDRGVRRLCPDWEPPARWVSNVELAAPEK